MECKIKPPISLLCMIGWMGVIFWFSAQPGDKSSDMSLNIGRLVGDFVISDYNQLPNVEQDNFAKNIEYGIRKTAHLLEYAILGGLVFWTAITWRVNKKKHVLSSLLFGVAYAAADELHQLFVFGRSGRMTDVIIDTAGVIIGVLCVRQFWGHIISKKSDVISR